ncbi:MAG: PAS domain S-box protein, partial [Methanoregula sp.]|nr:PAS domain S-box protein [Methanoregula sp.]
MEPPPETTVRQYIAGQKKYLQWMGGPVRSAFLFAVVLAIVLVPYWWLVVQWSSVFFADSDLRFTFITTTFLLVLIIADSTFLIRYYQIVRKREFERQAGELRESEERYRSLFDNMLDGFAHCRMIYDSDGQPEDLIYLNVNSAFDRIIGIKNVTGKRFTEVFPGVRQAYPELFLIYGRVALTGRPESFDIDFKPIEKWLHISVYSPEKEYFVAVFEDITDRKKAEQELTRIAKEWEVTFNATSDGICLIDANQKLRLCNNRMGEILGGMKPEDMAGQPCWVVVHKTTGPIPECPFVSAQKTLTRTRVEIPAGDLWFEVTADPVLDSSGMFAGAVHIMRDITDRKRVEVALSESEEKFRAIFHSASDAIHIHEIEPDFTPGKFIDVNDGACRMLMMSHEEILAHSPLDFAIEYHNPPLPEIIQFFKTKGGAVFETGHRRSDGVIVPVEINAHIINLQGKTVMLGIIRDITDRKKAEQELTRIAKEWEV